MELCLIADIGRLGPQSLVRVREALPGKAHRKKKVRGFPVPRRDVTTKLSLGGNNDVITELFLPRTGSFKELKKLKLFQSPDSSLN